jgi:hypothetical protein
VHHNLLDDVDEHNVTVVQIHERLNCSFQYKSIIQREQLIQILYKDQHGTALKSDKIKIEGEYIYQHAVEEYSRVLSCSDEEVNTNSPEPHIITPPDVKWFPIYMGQAGVSHYGPAIPVDMLDAILVHDWNATIYTGNKHMDPRNIPPPCDMFDDMDYMAVFGNAYSLCQTAPKNDPIASEILCYINLHVNKYEMMFPLSQLQITTGHIKTFENGIPLTVSFESLCVSRSSEYTTKGNHVHALVGSPVVHLIIAPENTRLQVRISTNPAPNTWKFATPMFPFIGTEILSSGVGVFIESFVSDGHTFSCIPLPNTDTGLLPEKVIIVTAFNV